MDEPGSLTTAQVVMTPQQHEALITALLDPQCWPQGGGDRRRIDTHISSVVLAGDLAYKIKKPLDLGFLDFLSLESRHQACNEELRLNGRLAPQIYLGVSSITGSLAAPRLDGDGPVIDWAVRMRRFDPDAILSQQSGRLDEALIDRLAGRVAEFHREAARCPPGQPFGSPAVALAPMRDNFTRLRPIAADWQPSLARLHDWTEDRAAALEGLIRWRKAEGRVRECHGDLHLGNVALIDGEPVVFDCIEFNPGLRWIDTVNDVAFLTMDLHHGGRGALAYRFLDRYLQASGDYEGLPLLGYYEVYRALVRAKIAAIRAEQPLDTAQRAAVDAEMASYVALAERLSCVRRGALVITCGVSGSGKSYHSERLPGPLRAVRLRSDVERKHLLGVEPTADVTALGGYAQDLTERTYARLAELAQQVVQAGFIAVVDATFLKRAQRARFRAIAEAAAVPFLILATEAPVEELRARIDARRTESGNVSDADVAVLEAQLATREPLDGDELGAVVQVGAGQGLDIVAIERRLAD